MDCGRRKAARAVCLKGSPRPRTLAIASWTGRQPSKPPHLRGSSAHGRPRRLRSGRVRRRAAIDLVFRGAPVIKSMAHVARALRCPLGHTQAMRGARGRRRAPPAPGSRCPCPCCPWRLEHLDQHARAEVAWSRRAWVAGAELVEEVTRHADGAHQDRAVRLVIKADIFVHCLPPDKRLGWYELWAQKMTPRRAHTRRICRCSLQTAPARFLQQASSRTRASRTSA